MINQVADSEALHQGDYEAAQGFYEQAIALEPDTATHYWYLGLALLLQGDEAAAHTTWMVPMLAADAEQVEQLSMELAEVLHQEAIWQATQLHWSSALLIRQHLHTIAPNHVQNQLHRIQCALNCDGVAIDFVITVLPDVDRQFMDPAQSLALTTPTDPDADWADQCLEILHAVLNYNPIQPQILDWVERWVQLIPASDRLFDLLFNIAIKVGYEMHLGQPGARLMALCAQMRPNDLEVLRNLATFYLNSRQYELGIKVAQQAYEMADQITDQVRLHYLLLQGLMGAGGLWSEAEVAAEQHEALILKLLDQPQPLDYVVTRYLINAAFSFPYLRDNLAKNRNLQNGLSQLCLDNLSRLETSPITATRIQNYQLKHAQHQRLSLRSKPLKIGYLSYCFRRHSVGWLARWLLYHHNRDRYQIHLYIAMGKQYTDPLQEWYIHQADMAHRCGMHGYEIADQIAADEVDILVDLDSVTLDVTYEVLALKPAPVQVSWLGWDGSGLPTVDYLIADPYVLPEDAQAHYREELWRLPQTYLAVDGFETSVPTLRREDLGIAADAVIYLSSQSGVKRYPETVQLQLQILHAVPNSYLLIKGWSDQTKVAQFFTEFASNMGIDRERLRFLPMVGAEEVHRANLAIADIVLDTYPYNGATTTLETLWMGIPLVTRVGQQFTARNSYTMLMNVGVTEGIAWDAEEYVQWGIRFGTEPDLRQQVAWKLRQSRHTAPLWNGCQFTREMESAYEQMWQRWLAS